MPVYVSSIIVWDTYIVVLHILMTFSDTNNVEKRQKNTVIQASEHLYTGKHTTPVTATEQYASLAAWLSSRICNKQQKSQKGHCHRMCTTSRHYVLTFQHFCNILTITWLYADSWEFVYSCSREACLYMQKLVCTWACEPCTRSSRTFHVCTCSFCKNICTQTLFLSLSSFLTHNQAHTNWCIFIYTQV